MTFQSFNLNFQSFIFTFLILKSCVLIDLRYFYSFQFILFFFKFLLIFSQFYTQFFILSLQIFIIKINNVLANVDTKILYTRQAIWSCPVLRLTRPGRNGGNDRIRHFCLFAFMQIFFIYL